MCAQCMATAMTAGTAATGMRVWLVARQPSWLRPRRTRRLTAGLIAVAVLAAGALGA